MRLSKILESSRASSPLSPCVIYQRPTQEHSDSYCLTYENGYRVWQHHKSFLEDVIQEKCRRNQQVVVAFLAQNSADLLLATLACTEIHNALPVLLNTRWTPTEMAQALRSQSRKDATVLVHDEAHANTIQQVAKLLSQNHRTVVTVCLSPFSTDFREFLQDGSREKSPHQHRNSFNNHFISTANSIQDDTSTAVILFTSGTTSGSKGVLLSHRALSIQAQAKTMPPCRYDANTRMLATTVPFFHVGGLNSALAVWMAGGSLVFPSQQLASSFQPQAVLQSLYQGPHISSNTLVVVPAMLSALMMVPQSKDETYPDVRLLLIGGQSATASLLRQLIQKFPHARVVQTYACTEAASSLTFLERYPPSCRHEPGSNGDCVGEPPEHIHLQLCRPAKVVNNMRETITEPYSVGVMATRGPHVLTGYWQRGAIGEHSDNPSIYACKSPLTDDDWFVTNDLGYQDSKGRFYFSGRVADVIRTGGETVLATEVERVLLMHKQVAECAVFALRDEKFGEAVCAAVVFQESLASETLSLADLRQWCAQNDLAGYKRPRRLFPVKALPRNSSGKLLKRLVVKQFHGAGTAKLRSKL